MKEEIDEKAWVINANNWDEPWHCPDEVFYANTIGQAKTKVLNHIKYENATDNHGNEFTFTNIKVMRSKMADKILFEGQPKTRYEIDSILETRNRDNELLKLANENPNTYAYIKKGGYYYRENNCGYTEYVLHAGIYPIKEAVKSVMGLSVGDYGRVILIDREEHNKMMRDEIAKLERKIIA